MENAATLEASNPRIVTIGGGTGQFAMLSSFMRFYESDPVDLTAVVSIADDGGSSGILRDERGVLPPGDILKCLLALSQLDDEAIEAFQFRSQYDKAKHTPGNLLLSNTQEKLGGDMTKAAAVVGRILRCAGTVLPVSNDLTTLRLTMPNGRVIDGESTLDLGVKFNGLRPNVSLVPPATITDASREAIDQADLVVVSPGSLYGSLAAVLVVNGVSEAIEQSRAKLAVVCNLVHEDGQTTNYSVSTYADEIRRFLGYYPDHVLYSTSPITNAQLQKAYAREGRTPVPYDKDTLANAPYDAIGGNFTSEGSLVRHSSRVARALIELARANML